MKLFGIRKKPHFLNFRSSTPFIVLTVASGVFTDLFLYGLVIPVLPKALVVRAGVAQGSQQRWITILLVTEATTHIVFAPVVSYYADTTSSRRLPFLLGLLLLGASLAIQTAAHSIGMYIGGRALQGLSAAIVYIVGLAIVVDTVQADRVGEYMGYVSLSMSIGTLLGPTLGGVVYDAGGYYAVFGLAFGVLGWDIIVRLTMVERHVAVERISTDMASESGSVNHNIGGELALNSQLSKDRPDSATFTNSRIPNTTLRTKEKRKFSKLPVFTLLKSPRLLATLWCCFVDSLIISSFEATLPLLVMDTFGWPALGGGLIFLPLAVPNFLAPFTGKLSDRFGARIIATIGFLLMVPPLVCLRIITHSSIEMKVLLCILLALIGVSLCLISSPMTGEVARCVVAKAKEDPSKFSEKSATTQAYGLFTMALQLGLVLGPLWGGLVRDSAGEGTVGWSLALLSGLSAALAFFVVRDDTQRELHPE